MLVLGVVACTVASASLAGSSRAKPGLQLMDGAPLTIRGTHFRARERVQITAASAGNTVTRTSAGAGGSFVLRLAIRYNRCSGLTVTARGAKGSRAVLKRPAIDCKL
jgi:hypothetical protein